MSRFDAQSYIQYRPLYPLEIFSPLLKLLPENPVGIDLGSGTGFSTASFLKACPSALITLVEPDADMLTEAKKLLEGAAVTFIHRSAEDFEVEKKVDFILVGSAWHWMNAEKVIDRVKKSLNDGGAIHIFEYQFPKCSNSIDLNEWVRREFNLKWKAPSQTPRGKLRELVLPLMNDNRFELTSKIHFDHHTELSADEFFGLITSQSRYLHYENNFSDQEKNIYRLEIRKKLNQWFGVQLRRPFFYRMSAFTFKTIPTNLYQRA